MKKRLLRHPELLLFGAAAAIYIVCVAPDLTWVNIDCDSFGLYLAASAGIDLEHPRLPHVYSGLGWLAIKTIWWGTEGWRLALVVSTLPAIGCIVVVFYAVKKQAVSKIAPYVGAAVLAGSAIFFSQATVQEIYTLSAFFIILAYTLSVYGRPRLAAASLGLTFFVNLPWAILASLALLASQKNVREKGLRILLLFALVQVCSLFYLGGYAWWRMLSGVVGGAQPLTILNERLSTIALVLSTSFGLGLISAFYYLKQLKKAWVFAILIGVPLCYFLFSTSQEGWVQMTTACPFIAVAAGLGIDKLRTKYLDRTILVTSLTLLLVMPTSWDIGRVIDKSPTTARQFLEQLKELPDDAIVTGLRGSGSLYSQDWHGILNTRATEIVYIECGKHLEIMNPSTYVLHNSKERKRLADLGYNVPLLKFSGQQYFVWLVDATLEFANANPDVPMYWVDVDRPEVFGCTARRLKLSSE